MEEKKKKLAKEELEEKMMGDRNAFESLLDRGQKGEGIINKIIEDSRNDAPKNNKKVKKGKKGATIIESYSIYDFK